MPNHKTPCSVPCQCGEIHHFKTQHLGKTPESPISCGVLHLGKNARFTAYSTVSPRSRYYTTISWRCNPSSAMTCILTPYNQAYVPVFAFLSQYGVFGGACLTLRSDVPCSRLNRVRNASGHSHIHGYFRNTCGIRSHTPTSSSCSTCCCEMKWCPTSTASHTCSR